MQPPKSPPGTAGRIGCHLSISGGSNNNNSGKLGAAPSEAKLLGIQLKWISLVSLTAQTSAQVFVIKWARLDEPRGGQYLASTVVLFTEVVKMVVSLLLVVFEMGDVGAAAAAIAHQCRHNRLELLKISVPSLLYTVQNNLMFFSLLKLSAAVQQVTYQLKILTTALLSVVMLGKALGATKWIALFILLSGVVLVQWSSPSGKKADLTTDSPGGPTSFVSWAGFFDYDAALGFAAVLVACFTSGFASVYLEKLLKQTDASIWMRNVQLGVFGCLMASVVAWSQDGDRIREEGWFQGYTPRVCCVVLTNALGGLLCASVLKYADNILRCFSTALSIILTCLLSASVLNEYEPDVHFIVGAFLAISATFLYSLGAPERITRALSTADSRACAGCKDVTRRFGFWWKSVEGKEQQ